MFGPRHRPGGAHLRQGSPRCNQELAIVCRGPRLGASGPAGNPCLTRRLLEMEQSRPGKPTVSRVHNLGPLAVFHLLSYGVVCRVSS